MVRKEVVAAKVARATAWLADAEPTFRLPYGVFRADRQARDLASFYLFLVIQECLDLAAHWIADAGWPPPDDAAAMFDLLAERGVIDQALATQLRGATGLRNRIAHGYATVDHDRVYREATAGLPALRAFLLLAAQTSGT